MSDATSPFNLHLSNPCLHSLSKPLLPTFLLFRCCASDEISFLLFFSVLPFPLFPFVLNIFCFPFHVHLLTSWLYSFLLVLLFSISLLSDIKTHVFVVLQLEFRWKDLWKSTPRNECLCLHFTWISWCHTHTHTSKNWLSNDHRTFNYNHRWYLSMICFHSIYLSVYLFIIYLYCCMSIYLAAYLPNVLYTNIYNSLFSYGWCGGSEQSVYPKGYSYHQ